MLEWRVSEIFHNNELLVLAIESACLEHGRTASVYWLKGNIELQAVVVRSQGVVTYFDNGMNEVSVDELASFCPDLQGLINSRL